jgi:hypothetical protein
LLSLALTTGTDTGAQTVRCRSPLFLDESKAVGITVFADRTITLRKLTAAAVATAQMRYMPQYMRGVPTAVHLRL